MAITVANEPDPRLIGAYAYEGGKAPAVRENIIETRRLAQDAAKTNLQIASNAQQNALDRDAKMQQMQINAAQSAYEKQLEQQGYADLNAQKARESDLNRQHQVEQAEAARRLAREKEFNDSVAAGLKDGTLYYAPQQKQQLAQIDQSIAQVYGDESIAPDQQEEMAARLHQKRRAIIPMVRPENERPVPIEQEMGNNTVVHTADGRIIPLAQLGRAAQPGEMIGTQETRNGTKRQVWKEVKPIKAEAETKPTAEEKVWSDPTKAMMMENNVRTQLQQQLDVEHKNKLAAWKRREAAHKAAEQAKVNAIPNDSTETYTPQPFGEAPPEIQLPTQESIGHELYRRSGGRTGIMPPEKTAEILQQAVSTMSGAAREAGEAALKLFLGDTPARAQQAPAVADPNVQAGAAPSPATKHHFSDLGDNVLVSKDHPALAHYLASGVQFGEGQDATLKSQGKWGYSIPKDEWKRMGGDDQGGYNEDLVKHDSSRLGAIAWDVTEADKNILGVPVQQGAMVMKVDPNSPMGKAGIPLNSAIVQVGNEGVGSAADLNRELNAWPPGSKVKLKYIHDGTMDEKEVTLPYLEPFQRAKLRHPAAAAGPPPQAAPQPAAPAPAPAPAPQDQGSPARITDDAAGQSAYEQLKPGMKYIHPDGTVRTKR